MSLANTWGSCADALVTRLRALDLEKRDGTTLPDASIKRRDDLAFYDQQDTLPLVLVIPRGKITYRRAHSEPAPAGSAWHGLPVTVAVLSAGDRDPTGRGDLQLNWHLRVIGEAPRVRGDVADVFHCDVEPEPVLRPAEAQRGWDFGAVTFRYIATLPVEA